MVSTGTTWDAVIEPRASLKDLDLAQVRYFLDLVRREGRRPVPAKTSDHVVLEKLNLVKGGVPTRAALLLFGKDLIRYFPTAYVRLGRFKSPTLIIDDKRVEGNVLQQIEECMLWFRERFQTEYVITGKPRRDVIWEYPLDAVREALVNAICHRDYLINTNIQVRLYDDRLEFWNPGVLLPPLTPADLLRDHDSIPRNRLLADCLFYCGIIERWGSGTTRIASALAEAGLVPPEFITGTSYRFGLIFRQERFIMPLLHQLKLRDKQIQTVMLLRFKEESITNEQYQKLFSVSKRTASTDLAELVDMRVLIKHGSTGKGVYYTLASKYQSKGQQRGSTIGSNRKPAKPFRDSAKGHQALKGATKGQ